MIFFEGGEGIQEKNLSYYYIVIICSGVSVYRCIESSSQESCVRVQTVTELAYILTRLRVVSPRGGSTEFSTRVFNLETFLVYSWQTAGLCKQIIDNATNIYVNYPISFFFVNRFAIHGFYDWTVRLVLS